MSILSKPYMHDEAAAFAHVEAMLWADGPVCQHCGVVDRAYPLVGVRSKPSKKNPEGVERHGLWKCRECRKQFTVRKGTIFEESHIPMHKWLQAIHLMVSSKKGISSHQLHRVLEITHKSAWFMSHRIREAMRTDGEMDFGAGGGMVEVDETFIGKDPEVEQKKRAGGFHHKMKVLTLVDRDTGRAKSFVIDKVSYKDILPILRENIRVEAAVFTDEATVYKYLRNDFVRHDHVTHSKDEYVHRTKPEVHTNTVEGFYSIFKRGMKGVYQHCSKKHLHRYAAEFDFRYSNRAARGVEDAERAIIALTGVAGKRLTYHQPNQ